VITRTFSKAYGLAGLRIGYSLSSPEMADILNRVRQPFNNNALALEAAEVALSDTDYLQQTVALNNISLHSLCFLAARAIEPPISPTPIMQSLLNIG
jgi:histidinol-phosphate aminotransferase